MKKVVIVTVCAAMMLSGCGTYAGTGAWAGGSLGSVLGSAIGGIAGGPRGSDVGTIVGMAGGAVIGGAIGTAADQKRQEDLEQYRRDRADRERQRQERRQSSAVEGDQYESYGYGQSANFGSSYDTTDSGFDATNSGDDRIYDFNGSDYTGDYSAGQPVTTYPDASNAEKITGGYTYTPTIEIINARFVDDNQNGELNRNEVCKLIFEIMNRGDKTVYDVVPTVIEATGNRHIYISPSIHVEKIEPGKGIRYTALIKSDGKLKDGSAKFCASVILGNKAISKVSEFNIPTRR